MILCTLEIPDLNIYATKTLQNDCFIRLRVDKLCPNYLPAANGLRSMYFLIKIEGMHLLLVIFSSQVMVAHSSAITAIQFSKRRQILAAYANEEGKITILTGTIFCM